MQSLDRVANRRIADVSHELRSPLAVVKEYCSLVRDGLAGPTTARQQELLGAALVRIDDMSRLVNDMLDIGRIESGGLPARRERASLENILCAAWPTLERRAVQKNISLELADEPCGAVYCDVDKAARTLINLAINAIKFTPAGGRVVVSTEAAADDLVRISVTDSGPGISSADLKAIFERLTQLAPGRLSLERGHGLGLSIARELAGLNLGELSATSELGWGSTFSFTLPLAEPAAVFGRQLDVWLAGGGSHRVALMRASLPYGASEELRVAADETLQSFSPSEQFVYRLGAGDWLVAVRCGASEFNRRRREIADRFGEWRRSADFAGECALELAVLGAWRADLQRAALCGRFQAIPVAMLAAGIAEQQRSLQKGARFFLGKRVEGASPDDELESSMAARSKV